MKTGQIAIVIGSSVVCFVGGFLLANSINRNEIQRLTTDHERLKAERASQNGPKRDTTLTDEEIQQTIAHADSDPQNGGLQKNLGIALYRYGSMSNDVDLVRHAGRILERANGLLPEDQDVLVNLGNTHYAIGYLEKDNAALEKARSIYRKALVRSPEDTMIRTDVGITFYLQTPPDNEKAEAEFRAVLSSDPKNVRAMEFMIRTLRRKGDAGAAEDYLAKLTKIDPSAANRLNESPDQR